MTSSATPDPAAHERIQCVFSIDDNYCQHLGVTLASLAHNNPGNLFTAHVIRNALSATNEAKLRELLAALPNFEARFYHFDTTPYAHFRLDGHISLASYFRLFLTDILPPDIDRVLYLDADIAILDDVRPLWDCRLDGALIGAVEDAFANSPTLFSNSAEAQPTSNERLGLPAEHTYFNAGILVIDLAAWRRNDLLPTFVKYVEANHGVLRFHDQDAMNAVLSGRVKYLPHDWNFQAKTTASDMARIGVPIEDFERMRRNPHIVHWTSSRKPWFYGHQVPYEAEYLRYLRLTPWRDFVPPDKTLTKVLGRKVPLLRALSRRLRGI